MIQDVVHLGFPTADSDVGSFSRGRTGDSDSTGSEGMIGRLRNPDSTGSDSYIYIGGSESRGKKIDVDRI